MPKKSKRQRRSSKWSRANLLNYLMGGIIAISMLLGSVFVFGGASTPPPPPLPTAVVTSVPSSLQAGSTPTVAVTPTP